MFAHDVDPIEMMVFLPALCQKMGAPYCIIKGKVRLGRLVHKKTCTTVAFTQGELLLEKSNRRTVTSVNQNAWEKDCAMVDAESFIGDY
ncbi:hypothetical protein A6R68_07570, partial [Neotoma lepida]